MVKNKIQIQLCNLQFSLFKNKKFTWIYLYNKNYLIFLKTNNNINVLKVVSSQLILIKSKFICTNNEYFQKYVKQINNYYFTKIKFAGKGYKIKKNNVKNMLLLFNRAHITNIWWRNLIVKKLKKYKIYIRYTGIDNKIIKTILSVRNINIFTKKGLRKSKQILFKKKGKK